MTARRVSPTVLLLALALLLACLLAASSAGRSETPGLWAGQNVEVPR